MHNLNPPSPFCSASQLRVFRGMNVTTYKPGRHFTTQAEFCPPETKVPRVISTYKSHQGLKDLIQICLSPNLHLSVKNTALNKS